MKKAFIVIGILFLTGCGKRLICSSDTNNSVSDVYKVSYKGNSIISIVNEKTYRFDDKETFKSFENLMNYKVESTSTDNIKVSYKKKKNKYILISKYDVSNMTDGSLKELGLSNNFSEFKDTLVGYGLMCK